ncbi:hypothetical protein WCE37_05835 [Luteimonas sp. MJ250]|uniref:hypothetical protein n=1 Tax=Luteimonas sp. MJ250 TaxID=3129236 RepID=UPI0031BB67CA
MDTIAIDNLQEGDILLMMGDGPLSDLIAWASDGTYSHAAMVVDQGELIEASLAGVRRYPLAKRLGEVDHYHWVDAFRAHGDQGRPFDSGERRLVREHAQALLGAPYPVDQLALFGAIMALRGKWPAHPWARKLVRLALDRAVPSESPAMLCSEVVYRSWAECAVEPRGRLAPRIVEGERGRAPFPGIDWQRLIDEMGPLLGTGAAGAGARRTAPGLFGAEALFEAGDDISDEALDQASRRVLSQLQPDSHGLMRSAGTDTSLAHNPNPRLVSPQDLANSPGVGLLGRLMQRSG